MSEGDVRYRRGALGWLWLVCAVVFGWGSVAQAHQTALSSLAVDVDEATGVVEMRLTMSPSDLAEHLGLDPDKDGSLSQAELAQVRGELVAYVEPRLQVLQAGERCASGGTRVDVPARRMATVSFVKRLECAVGRGELELVNRVLLDAHGSYTHYARVSVGADIHHTVFDLREPSYTLKLEGAGLSGRGDGRGWKVVGTFLWQGILHIALGLDHVLFVLCLLLAARDLRRLLGVVTTFTVAHSVTLVLSTLGVVAAPAGVVEPLIAASIVWVALEILLGREPGAYLYGVTFGFGLLHGFGFGYVLEAYGLPEGAELEALAAFNVGVEVGQVAIVAAAFPLLRWVEQRPWGGLAPRVVAGGVLAVAVFWGVERVAALVV